MGWQHLKNKNIQYKKLFRSVVNTESLWKAFKIAIAKDINSPNIPHVMYFNIIKHELPDTFAEFFHAKVKTIVYD